MTDEPQSDDMMSDEEIFQWHADALAEANREHASSAGPIEIQPTGEQRARWEGAAQASRQTLEEFMVAALDSATEYAAYARAMRARKRGRPEE